MHSSEDDKDATLLQRVRRKLIGAPKEIRDPSLFHKISLIPLFAWIGFGADGLSSSAYGPEEAFRALGEHTYLALLLAAATAVTVFTISYAYSYIIEDFPHGGGGYIVATHMIGERAGVISGSALLVDYVLTITVSIASCADAVFSFLPLDFQEYKLPAVCFLLVLLMILNIRGVKESIAVLAPIFVVFIATHALMLLGGLITQSSQFGPLVDNFNTGIHRDLASIGFIGVLALFLRAYSLGGGTYTGIEAVSNGLQIVREPRVQNGKRTMLYMASSLAFTAGVLFLCYSLLRIRLVEGRTLNAVLADALFAHWPLGGTLAVITIFSEGALLLVAAQTGFVDGPRVMANMAVDSWFPRRFATLSERLTMQNGIVLMGVSAFAILLYTHGSVSALVVMYSINVFITFSLSEFGMSRFYVKERRKSKKWLRRLSVHTVGLVLCLTILIITVVEKFTQGGWMSLLMTSFVIGICYLIRGHYGKVRRGIAKLDEMLVDLPITGTPNVNALKRDDQTAIQLVSGYNSFGIHTLFSIARSFPNLYKNVVFISIAVIDSSSFKGAAEIGSLEESVRTDLLKYVDLARKLGFAADYRMAVATEVVKSAVDLSKATAKEYPRSTVFMGQIAFRLPKAYQKLLHNETSLAIQRELHWSGITTVILPIRIKL